MAGLGLGFWFRCWVRFGSWELSSGGASQSKAGDGRWGAKSSWLGLARLDLVWILASSAVVLI